MKNLRAISKELLIAKGLAEVADLHKKVIVKVEEIGTIATQAKDQLSRVQKLPKGDKGDQGERGPQGVGVPGKDGRDGKDGISIDPVEIAQLATHLITTPKDGKDGQTPQLDTIVGAVIEEIKSNDTFEIDKKIGGVKSELASYRNQLAGKHYGKDTWARGGGTTVSAGTNITLTPLPNGTTRIDASGGGGTPGGLNTQLQYNNAGSFGGISGATTDGTIVSLTNPVLGGATITTSTVNGVTLTTGGLATTFLNGAGAYTTPAGGGDVVGPGSATDNAIARYDGTTGKLIQNSVVTIADTNGNTAGVGTLGTSGKITITQGTADTGILSSTGYSVTGSGTTSLIDITGTWNTSGAPVGISFDITDTASASTALAMRIRGGTTATNTLFAVSKSGGILMGTTGSTAQTKFSVNSSGSFTIQTNAASNSTVLTSVSDNTLQMGNTDNATTVVAQTFRSQGALTGGANNVAGQNWTFIASPGKGTGAGGSFIFQTAPAGASGNTQNTPVTALTIDSTGMTTALGVNVTGSTIPANGIYLGAANQLNFSSGSNSRAFFNSGGSFISANGGGFRLSGAAASATNPSFAPNNADSTTGFGAQASGNISAIVGGAEIIRTVAAGEIFQGGKNIVLTGSSTGTATIQVAAAAGTGTIFQLPADNGTNTYVLQTNGSGITSWVPQSGGSGITIGTTTITSGTNTRILYNNSGVVGEYTLTGTGTVAVMQTSPTLITPVIGVATGTSLTLSTAGLPLSATNSTDAASNQVLLLKGTRATPAANDEIYQSFNMNSSTGVTREFARIDVIGTTVTDSAEVGLMKFYITNSGTLASRLELSPTLFYPTTNDQVGLGSGSKSFSDLFLASGGVINWAAGDATLTHSTGRITSNVPFAASYFAVPNATTGSAPTNGMYTAGTNEIDFNTNTTLRLTISTSAIASTLPITVSGVAVPTISSTDTLTNKRITKRVTSSSSGGATPTIATDTNDMVVFTAQAAAITNMSTNTTGTPTNGQTLWISITDNATPRTISWGASYEASTIALPTTTVISTRLDVGFVWNVATTKWRCVAVA